MRENFQASTGKGIRIEEKELDTLLRYFLSKYDLKAKKNYMLQLNSLPSMLKKKGKILK